MCLAAVFGLTMLVLSSANRASLVRAQAPVVVAEQVVRVGAANGLVSATLDPGRRYTLQVVPWPDGASFRGNYFQNWFTREGARRAGSNEGGLTGRAPWEQELPLPVPSLVQWTFAASVWSDGGGALQVRIVDHGPR
jgi:hypothetical protein